jgi:hypothetical protein
MPLGLNAPAVEGIVREQSVVEAAPACDAAALGACVVLLAAVLEDAPDRLVDAVAAPVVDPAGGMTDVGTLNGSEPQLGAPNMKPTDALDVEQNMMPPVRFPLEPEEKDGLDGVAGTGAAAVPGAGLTCAVLVWACAASIAARRIMAKMDTRSIEPSLLTNDEFARHDRAPIHD